MKYTEIFKLKKMLEDAKIPFVFDDRSNPKYEYYQIDYPALLPYEKRVCSVIQGNGTYGNIDNKLEIMGLLTNREKQYDDVLGWLSAEDVFKRIESHYRGEGNEVLTQ